MDANEAIKQVQILTQSTGQLKASITKVEGHLSDEEFKDYCKKQQLKIPYSGLRLRWYDFRQEIKYYLCVIGIGYQVRRVGSYVKRKILRR